MAIRDLLVTVDGGPSSEARTALAASLAAQFEAHLIGLHPSSTAPANLYSASFDSALFDAAMRESISRQQQRSEHARVGFEAVAARHALSSEWRVARGFAGPDTVLNSRYADLAVVGQRWTDFDGLNYPDPADVVLDAGCPVLVVPAVGQFDRIERHALIAWNAGREAARAARDALPLLKRVRSATVLVVDPMEGPYGHGEEPGADIARHLARHGIKVEIDRWSVPDANPADVILSRAADYGSDLIVMGAYGHSRVRELVLGGVTRSILQQMTVPVLMSH